MVEVVWKKPWSQPYQTAHRETLLASLASVELLYWIRLELHNSKLKILSFWTLNLVIKSIKQWWKYHHFRCERAENKIQ